MRPAIICSIRARNGPSRVPKTVTGNKTEALDVEMVQMLFEDLSEVVQQKNAHTTSNTAPS